jgi:hypothetical protein
MIRQKLGGIAADRGDCTNGYAIKMTPAIVDSILISHVIEVGRGDAMIFRA